MMKYYYKTVIIKPESVMSPVLPHDKMEEELNRLGELGWELVSTTLETYPYQLLLILKNTEENLNMAK